MELLIYLLKVSACTVLFFAFYLLVLRHLTFFKINRFYLLITLALSFVIPTLNFTIEREVEVTPAAYTQSEVGNEVIVNEAISATGSIETTPFIEESFDYYSLLPYLYFAIVSSLLIVATWRILKLIKYTKGIKHELNGLKIVQKSAGFTNCSFFNYVFIDEKLSEAELQVLLKHEEVHAKQLHSIDKLVLMLIKAFLWFNPVVYLYDKALEQAHEYEADEATSQNFGTEQYANLLLRLAIAKSEMPLVHNFVKSPIKDRIKMLFNSKSKNMKKLVYLLALPIGLGLLWGFTVKVVEVAKDTDVVKESKSAENYLTLDKKLLGKTLKGEVKSILLTDVGEVLNFKYDNGVIRVFNYAKGRVSLGDELSITIGGIIEGMKVYNAKGNILKELDAPCYGLQMMKTLDGAVLYKSDLQGTIKSQQQKNIDKIKKYEAFRKSPEFAKKLKEMENINSPANQEKLQLEDSLIGKTVTGKVIGFETTRLGEVLYLHVVSTTIPITCSYFKDKVKVGDEIKVGIVGRVSTPPPPIGDPDRFKSLMSEKSYFTNKVIGAKGQILYEAPKYAFLYEANKARYAWSKIKSFDKFSDGTVKKIVLQDKGFTINLNVADQKFTTQNFKIGDSVVVKFFGEKLIAKNTYTTDKMIVLYSWPRKYELKNKELYDRFYNKDGTQKINKPFPKKPEVGKITPLKPILTRSSSITFDTKTDVTYVTNGVYKIGEKQLDADEIAYDKRNEKLTAKNGKLKLENGSLVSEKYIIYDLKKNSYITNNTPDSKIQVNSGGAEFITNLKAQNNSLNLINIFGQPRMLTGKVVVEADNYILNAKVLEAEPNSNIIKAHKASVLLNNGSILNGDIIEYDIVSKNYKIINPSGSLYSK